MSKKWILKGAKSMMATAKSFRVSSGGRVWRTGVRLKGT